MAYVAADESRTIEILASPAGAVVQQISVHAEAISMPPAV